MTTLTPSQERLWGQGPAHRGERCTHTSSGVAAVLLRQPTGSQAPSSGAQPGSVLGSGAVLGGDAGGSRTQAGWVARDQGGRPRGAQVAEVQRAIPPTLDN